MSMARLTLRARPESLPQENRYGSITRNRGVARLTRAPPPPPPQSSRMQWAAAMHQTHFCLKTHTALRETATAIPPLTSKRDAIPRTRCPAD